MRPAIEQNGAETDARPIRCLSSMGSGWIGVGEDGVTRIVPTLEPGQMGNTVWFAVYKGEEVWRRVNGLHVEYVEYETVDASRNNDEPGPCPHGELYVCDACGFDRLPF